VTNLAGSAAEADVVVVVLSESPYAEFTGDRSDINSLPSADFTALSNARASGKPVVAIVMSGRPVEIESALGNADAWIAAWLPGTEGDGVADVLFGDYDFTGRLSHSWPHGTGDCNVNYYDNGYNPLFAYDYGCTIAGGCP
jgi:beta-glucosidase